jgi:UMF1 family MFS transporter
MDWLLRRTRLAGSLYEWATSAFVTTVVTVFFGPYLTLIASRAADSQGNISIFGVGIYSESLFSYVVSFSVLLQVLFLPLIGTVADITNQKKRFLYLFAYLGSFFTVLLFFLYERTLYLGITAFILANLFFGASVVMYNSLLVEIAEVDERDKVSLIGWAFGYIGGGILLAINLVTIYLYQYLNQSYEEAIRMSLASAGIWWLVFSIISQTNLILPIKGKAVSLRFPFRNSIPGLIKTFKEVLKNKNALLFFVAYLFYNDGVQTIIVISSQFGRRELNLSMDFLVVTLLLVQFLSFFGTLIIMKIDNYLQSKKTLLFCLLVWTFTVVFAFLFLKDSTGFIVLAVLISLVLGGTQAISRSIFSTFIPKEKEAEYFSFYEITEKGSSWIGPLFFGLILQLSKSYRIAILSLILFFLLGIFLLLKIKIKEIDAGVSR